MVGKLCFPPPISRPSYGLELSTIVRKKAITTTNFLPRSPDSPYSKLLDGLQLSTFTYLYIIIIKFYSFFPTLKLQKTFFKLFYKLRN